MNPFDDRIGILARQSSEFDRLRDALRHQNIHTLSWLENSNTELIRQMDNSFIRTQMGELSTMKAMLENSSKPFVEDMGVIRTAAQELQAYYEKFQNPIEDHINQISATFKALESVKTLGLATDHISTLSESLAGVQSHWVDFENTNKSFRAASELYAISAGLADFRPFGGRLTDVLRADLGDWRHVKTIPDSILTDPVERFGFYRYKGFDDSLTDFPETAFDDLLVHSGLRRSEWPTPALDYDNGILIYRSGEEEEVPERNQAAYQVIYRLETRLRQFIDEEMTKCFGIGWEKHQTSDDLYSNWIKKRNAAIKAGDSKDAPLIAYADFTDYVVIIERKDNWNQVFKSIFSRKTDIQESLVRLQPVRICTMHSRVVTADDQLFLNAEAQRIFRALGL